MEADIVSSLNEFLGAVKDSSIAREYASIRAKVYENDTNSTLMQEYERLQMTLQRAAISGSGASADDMDKFQKLAALLMMGGDTQRYILAGMRLQQLMAEITGGIAQALGLDLSGLMNMMG